MHSPDHSYPAAAPLATPPPPSPTPSHVPFTPTSDAISSVFPNYSPTSLATYTPTSFRNHTVPRRPRNTYTHNFHWYPAKLFPEIPARILDLLRLRPGTVVLDPFCGSGTVLVEAAARNCFPIGFDINPIARLISRAKTTPLSPRSLGPLLGHILTAARTLRNRPASDHIPPYWFTSPARTGLYRLYQSITAVATNPRHADFFLTALTNITRRCSLADPYIPPPVKMRPDRFEIAGPRYRKAYERTMSLHISDIYQLFASVANTNMTRLSRFDHGPIPTPRISSASALSMHLPDSSVDVVITSPPYCGAQKYIRTFRLELLLLGYSPSQIRRLDHATLGTEKSVWSEPHHSPFLTREQHVIIDRIMARNSRRARMLELYLDGLHKFAIELERVLKPGAHAFVSLGQSHFSAIPVDLADCFLQFTRRRGYTLEARLTDQIPTRLMITKRSSTANVIPADNILWLRKAQ